MSSFRKLAVVSTAATFVLITLGAVVRSTGSGLGCADAWPDCSGHILPDFTNRHQMIEFSHRMVAGILVFLIAALVVAAIRSGAGRRLVAPSVGALFLVLGQAALGAVVVKLDLDASSVVLHLVTALSLLALLLYILAISHPEAKVYSEPVDADVSRTARIAAGASLFLLGVGSYMSGIEGSGRVFNDWPLMDGRLVPDLAIELKAVHFFHRAAALVVGLILAFTLAKILKRKAQSPTSAKLAHAVLILFAVEVLIGALNVWTDLNAAVVTAHLLVGEAIWASLITIVLITSPRVRTHLAGASAPRTQVAEQGV